MAKPKGTAEIDSAEIDSAASDTAVAAEVSAGAAELPADHAEVDEEAKASKPPRRRLVAELLEGQEFSEAPPSSGLQLVAPPLHLQPDDAGQPIYQLDLSSEEPQGEIVAPSPYLSPREMASVATTLPFAGTYDPVADTDAGALQRIRQMIVHRERRVMAAERDGIGAYELAIELDEFVRSLLAALRRVEG